MNSKIRCDTCLQTYNSRGFSNHVKTCTGGALDNYWTPNTTGQTTIIKVLAMILRTFGFIWTHTTVSNIIIMAIIGVPIMYNLAMYFIYTPCCYIWNWVVSILSIFKAVGVGVTSFETQLASQFSFPNSTIGGPIPNIFEHTQS